MQRLRIIFGSSRFQLDAALFVIRLTIGSMMAYHGWEKLLNFRVHTELFPDPIGLGAKLSLFLVVFAEFFGGLALIFGFLTRFFALNIFVAMAVAVFIVHAQDPFGVKELAAVFMLISSSIVVCGAGSITIYGTKKIKNAYITLNDSLVVQGESFRKLKLDSVSIGKNSVKIVSKQTWGRELHNESFEITVRVNSNTDIIANVPSGTAQNVAYLSLIGLFASLPFLFL